jgi:hypothetical protein
MATAGMSVFSILFALLSGGANDLLDFVSSDAYWKTKAVTVSVEQLTSELKTDAGADISELIKTLGSGNYPQREEAARKIIAQGAAALPGLEKAGDDADPEIANRAKVLVQQIRLKSKGNSVRRLMAIRTLGEMKKGEALPALKALLGSKEMFVPDYAARAIAQIQGQPLPVRAAPREALKTDLTLLPANVAVIGQVSFPSGKAASLDEALKSVPPQPGENRQATLDQLTGQIIAVAEQIGNVRVEAITFGVCDTVGPNDGFFATIVHGQYDAAAVSAFLQTTGLPITTVAGATVLKPEQEVALAFPADDRALFTAGAAAEKLPVKEILEAAANAAGGQKGAASHPLMAQAEFAPFMASLNEGVRAWVICKVSDSYRAAPVFQPFDTITLLGRQEKENLTFRVAGAGKDVAAVKGAVDQVNQGIQEAKNHLPQMAQQMPMLQPIVDFANSIQCDADGKNATLIGAYKGDAGTLLAMPLMMFGMRAQAEPAQPPAAQIQPK